MACFWNPPGKLAWLVAACRFTAQSKLWQIFPTLCDESACRSALSLHLGSLEWPGYVRMYAPSLLSYHPEHPFSSPEHPTQKGTWLITFTWVTCRQIPICLHCCIEYLREPLSYDCPRQSSWLISSLFRYVSKVVVATVCEWSPDES